MEKSRKRAERRKKDYAKALRKKHLSDSWTSWPWYSNLHEYSKNKIHCSCAMCSCKSRPKKYYGGQPAENWSFHDIRIFDSMNAQITELRTCAE